MSVFVVSEVRLLIDISQMHSIFQDNATKVQDALAAANSVAQETLSCIRTVIGFASEDLEYKKYVDRIDDQYRLNIKQTYITGIYYMVKEILIFCS
jgi:ATP-binding cassette subfamily B (MDR/TAP) protein 9